MWNIANGGGLSSTMQEFESGGNDSHRENCDSGKGFFLFLSNLLSAVEIAYCYLRIINYVLWFVKGPGRGVLFGGSWYGNSSNRCLVFGTQSIIHTYIYVIQSTQYSTFCPSKRGSGRKLMKVIL